VRWLLDYFQSQCNADQNYVFETHDRKQMKAETINGRVKAMLKMIGMSAKDVKAYGSHSCRRGGATRASQQNVPVNLLKRHGNWKSDAVFVYIDDSIGQKLAVGAAIIDGTK
jgi:hypothetical protein